MAFSGLPRIFIRRASLKRAPQPGTLEGTSKVPANYENYVNFKERAYVNSGKVSHLNSRFSDSTRGWMLMFGYTALVLPWCAYVYNADKNGTKK